MVMMDVSQQRATTVLRWLLLIAAALLVVIGTIGYVRSGHTDQFFAWTVRSPLTAAFLGAAYLASGFTEFASARRGPLAYARMAGSGTALFATITLVVTIAERGTFHFGPGNGPVARVVAWMWLAVFVALPIAAVAMLATQRRSAAVQAVRRLPQWLRTTLTVQATLMIVVGAVLLFAPNSAGKVWPWPLTVLTAQAIGAWSVGLGCGVAQAIDDDDWLHLRLASPLYAIFGLLGLAAVVRYTGAVRWHHVSAWVLVVMLVSMLAVGLYARRAGRPTPQG